MPAIPEFPDFQPVGLEHRDEIVEFTGQFPSYSDFNFGSLYSWNTDDDMSVSRLNDNLVLECKDYTSDAVFYSFLGGTAVEETAHTLLQQAELQGYDPELRLVPEVVAEPLVEHSDFAVVEDPDSHDYLLSVPELAAIQGRRFKHTREAFNRFQRDYGEVASFREGDVSDDSLLDKLRGIFFAREEAKGTETQDYQKEFTAFARSVGQNVLDGLRIFAVHIGNEPQAFVTYEQVDACVGIAHFSKCNMEFRGIFQFMMKSLGQALQTEGVEILNIEQDLGLPGLRLSKQCLRPISQLKKYAVRLGTSSLLTEGLQM